MERTHVAVEPRGTRSWLDGAVEAGGGQVVDPSEASAAVWGHHADPEGLDRLLTGNPSIEWVQLPWAGIEVYVDTIRRFGDRGWTCGKGVYADPVAEHALALALAGFRGLPRFASSTSWGKQYGRNLLGAKVVVLGGGGITEAFVRLLAPFGCSTTVVRRRPDAIEGATVVGVGQLDDVLPGADLLVLALALTPATVGMVDGRRLRMLAPDGWVVNVARGGHIVTDDLVEVLAEGAIGGAALDVTDPEPLPDGHPLWGEPRCLITPHTGNTVAMAEPLLRARVGENVRRWIAGEELIGRVDVDAGY
jgi:phosphoglycerate dehydrogenase-like enzyme